MTSLLTGLLSILFSILWGFQTSRLALSIASYYRLSYRRAFELFLALMVVNFIVLITAAWTFRP